MNEQDQEKEFDRLLKNKSAGFELKPSEEVWQKVESSLRQNRRRKFLWWSMAAIFVSVIGAGSYFILQNENSGFNSSSVQQTSVENKNSPDITHSSDMGEANSAVKEESSENKSSGASTKSMNANPVSKSSAKNNSVQKEVMRNEVSPVEEESSVATNERSIDDISFLNGKYLNPLYEEEKSSPTVRANAEVSNDFISSLTQNIVSHHFAVELDAVPAACYSWNKPEGDLATSAIQPPSNNSFWENGFSAGGNFLFNMKKSWLLGGGIHFTSTNTKIAFTTQTVAQFDTTFSGVNNTTVATIDTVYMTYVPSEKFSEHWVDVSFLTGTQLFSSSKNHLRILAGAAYSRLISSQSEYGSASIPYSFDVAGTGAGTNFSDPHSISTDLAKNQFQLLTEAAYVRDLGPHFNFSAGVQIHYYPLNLFTDNSIRQHLLWLGAKIGMQYSF